MNISKFSTGGNYYKADAFKVLFFLVITFCTIATSRADAVSSLADFFNTVNTLRAEFRQTVYDSDELIIDESTGVLYIARPGRFRWEYASPLPQSIISDANKIWIHDIELEQVTVRNYEQTLAGTPAELLAGGGNVNSQYLINPLTEPSDGFEWVQLVPKVDDTQFVEIRIGFSDGKLKIMQLTDSFERITQLVFDNVKENAPINLSLFQFDIPDNVDVINNTENF